MDNQDKQQPDYGYTVNNDFSKFKDYEGDYPVPAVIDYENTTSSSPQDQRANNLESYATLINPREIDDPSQRMQEYYTAARSEAENLKSEMVLKNLESTRSGLRSYVSSSTSQEVLDKSSLFPDYIQESEDEVQSPLAAMTAVARQLLPEGTDERMVREKAFQLEAQNTLGEMLQENNWFGNVVDFAGMLIPSMLWDLKVQGVDGIDDWDSFVNNFQSLDPEKKIVIFKSLKDQLINVQDNNKLLVLSTLEKLLSPDGAAELQKEFAIDAVNVGLSALDVATIATAANKSIRSAKTFKALSDAKIEANASGAAINSKEVADRIGLPQDIAAMNATPFRNEAILVEARDGIHNETIEAAVNNSIDSTTQLRGQLARTLEKDFSLKPEIMTDEGRSLNIEKAKAALIKEVTQKYSKVPLRMGAVKVTQISEHGFTLELPITRYKSNVMDDEIYTYDYAEKVGSIYGPSKDPANGYTLDEDVFVLHDNEVPVLESTAFGPAKDGETSEVITREITFGDDSYGDFGQINTFGPIREAIASPKNKFPMQKGDPMDRFINNAELVESTSDRLREFFKDSYSYALKPLGNYFRNKASYKRVEAVLQRGDMVGETGKRFTPEELYRGIIVDDGTTVRLSEKEMQAYYNYLEVSDFAWVVENQMERQVALANGYKHIRIPGYEEQKLFGRPIDDSAKYGHLHSVEHPNTQVWEMGVGRKRLGEMPYKQLSLSNKKLVQLDKAIPVKVGVNKEGEDVFESFSLLLVDQSSVKELPYVMKPFREAYVPKINKHVRFVVKEHIPGKLNGIDRPIDPVDGGGVTSNALRFFDSRKAAQRWADKQYQLNGDKTRRAYVVHEDRESILTGNIDGSASRGGLFTGARSSDEILFGEEGSTPERVPPFEAMMRNLSYISNKYPRNEWRIAAIRRFEETVRKQLPGSRDWSWGKPLPDNATSMKSLQRYLEAELKMPTYDEWSWQAHMNRLAEWMEGKAFAEHQIAGTNLRRAVLNIADKDPAASMRALAFHGMLGWFNPAQFLVQAMGATVGLSMHPIEGSIAIKQGAVLRMVMFAKDEQVVRMTAAKMGENPDDFVQMWKQFIRSGLRDSIKNTADHAAVQNGFGYDKNGMISSMFGAVGDTVRKGANKGLVFYREGEFFNRGFSWILARRLWQKANPGKVIDEAAEREIFGRSQELSLSLGRANRAQWQKGWVSVPTQFLQVQAKMIESLLPSALGGTKALDGMRWRLLAGQTAIFGSLGIPFGYYLTNQMAGLLGIEPEDVPEPVVNFARQGIIGSLFGYDLDIARRGAIAADLENTVFGLFTEDKALGESLFGAFGGMFGRTTEGFRKLAPLFSEVDWSAEDYVAFSTGLLNSISTFNNAEKAYIMYSQQKYYDNSGRVVAKDFQPVEILGQAFGFSPTRITDVYAMLKDKNKRTEFRQKYSKHVMSSMRKYFTYVDENDAYNGKQMAVYINNMVNGLSPSDRKAVMTTIQNAIKEPKTTEEKLKKQVIQDWASDSSDKLIRAELWKDYQNKQEGNQ